MMEATPPTTPPSNPGYRFDGWTPAVGPITSATTFNAIWTPIYVNYSFNWGVAGVTNPRGQVRYNTAPTPPTTPPSNPGYRFDGWEPAVGPITVATTFNAIWNQDEQPVYVNYTFNWGIDGVANPSGQVRYNTQPTPPTEIPSNPGYTFAGWHPVVSPITADTTFNAIWNQEVIQPICVNYTFNWRIEGITNPSGQVWYNTPPTVPTEIPINPGYRFNGWDPEVGPITEDTTFNAIWIPICINYIFDWGIDGVTNPHGQVRYNTAPPAPTEIPSNPGYTFVGWDLEISPITEDTTFTAIWIPITACINDLFD